LSKSSGAVILHIEQSLAVADVNACGQVVSQPQLADGDQRELETCPSFTLQLLAGQLNSIALNTGGESFHALTLIEDRAQVEGADGGLDCFGRS
jgi:hypothetical protein